MPSSDPAQRFQDILDNIALVRSYLDTTSPADFSDGGMIYDATCYCFLRIAEAATKLGSFAEDLAPMIQWNRIRGLGNHLRHAYDGIDPGVLWNAAHVDFPSLEGACRAAISRLEASD